MAGYEKKLKMTLISLHSHLKVDLKLFPLKIKNKKKFAILNARLPAQPDAMGENNTPKPFKAVRQKQHASRSCSFRGEFLHTSVDTTE